MPKKIRLYTLSLLLVLSSSLIISCTETKQPAAPKTVLNTSKGQDLIEYYIKEGRMANHVNLTKEKIWTSFLKNRSLHQEIWSQITAIFPPDQLLQISQFTLSHEPTGNYSMFVQPFQESDKWSVNININREKNEMEFISILLHELGRMVTLNKKQINFNKKENKCTTYYIDEYGCSHPASYINQFYQQFWRGTIKEWASYKNKDSYYEKHLNNFITVHAATDPVEDINESFAYFMSSKKPLPSNNTIMAKKITFFYKYPELVKMREASLFRIKKYMSQLTVGC